MRYLGPLYRWDCPRRCGYYREWNESPEFLGSVIIHPIYGRIYEGQLVHIDIKSHSCRLAWMARRRSPKGRLAPEAMPAVRERSRTRIRPDRLVRV